MVSNVPAVLSVQILNEKHCNCFRVNTSSLSAQFICELFIPWKNYHLLLSTVDMEGLNQYLLLESLKLGNL